MSVFAKLCSLFKRGSGHIARHETSRLPAGAGAGVLPGGGDNPKFERVRMSMLRAIIHTARAHNETRLARALEDVSLPDASWRLVEPILAEDVSPETVARGAGDDDEALVLYILSRYVVRDAPVVNHEYFEQLAAALRITPAGKIEIERKIGRMKRRDVSLN